MEEQMKFVKGNQILINSENLKYLKDNESSKNRYGSSTKLNNRKLEEYLDEESGNESSNGSGSDVVDSDYDVFKETKREKKTRQRGSHVETKSRSSVSRPKNVEWSVCKKNTSKTQPPEEYETPKKVTRSNAKKSLSSCKKSTVTPIKLKRKLFSQNEEDPTSNQTSPTKQQKSTNLNDCKPFNIVVNRLERKEKSSKVKKGLKVTESDDSFVVYVPENFGILKSTDDDIESHVHDIENIIIPPDDQRQLRPRRSRSERPNNRTEEQERRESLGNITQTPKSHKRPQTRDPYKKVEGISRSSRLSLLSSFQVESAFKVAPDCSPRKEILDSKNKETMKNIISTPTSTRTSRTRRLKSVMEDENEEIIKNKISTPTTPRTPKIKRLGSVLKDKNNVSTPTTPRTPKTRRPSTSSLRTPKQRVMLLTPSVGSRGHQTKTPSTPVDHARLMLHVSAEPESLPCREKEFKNIYAFVIRKMDTKSGGYMYVSGMPGTGKTATVLRVIKKLQKTAEDEGTEFKFVDINSLSLTEPRQAYTKIWKKLTEQNVTSEQAQKLLEKKFTKNKEKLATVLLIDELDCLCNKKQDVVYNILDWTTKDNSRLIVITIANTMDLPERTLKGKINSRMGLTRLVFHPYTFNQLEEIVLCRLSGNKLFHPDAVRLAARKVASISGDARRALDICRRATNFVKDVDEVITVSHIEQAINQIMCNLQVLLIKNCSALEQSLLRAIRDELLRRGIEECNLLDLYPQLQAICTLEGLDTPSIDEVYVIGNALARCGLIIVDQIRSDITRKMSLNISSDDIHYAIKK